jgi:hypothetical protein
VNNGYGHNLPETTMMLISGRALMIYVQQSKYASLSHSYDNFCASRFPDQLHILGKSGSIAFIETFSCAYSCAFILTFIQYSQYVRSEAKPSKTSPSSSKENTKPKT